MTWIWYLDLKRGGEARAMKYLWDLMDGEMQRPVNLNRALEGSAIAGSAGAIDFFHALSATDPFPKLNWDNAFFRCAVPLPQYNVLKRILSLDIIEDVQWTFDNSFAGAVNVNDVELIHFLIDNAPDDYDNFDSGEALSRAAELGNDQVVKYILDQGTVDNDYLDTALALTVFNAQNHNTSEDARRWEIVDYLIEAGTDPNPVLIQAVHTGDSNGIADILLARGANSNILCDQHEEEIPLVACAAVKDTMHVVDVLDGYGADVEAALAHPAVRKGWMREARRMLRNWRNCEKERGSEGSDEEED